MSDAATLGDILISVYENTYVSRNSLKSALVRNAVSGYGDVITAKCLL